MQIKITDITPFMRKGWVAMDFGGEWFWYNEKPTIHNDSIWHSPDDITFCISLMYDISPADDWTKSLIKIDNTAREKFEKEYQNNIQKTIQELQDD